MAAVAKATIAEVSIAMSVAIKAIAMVAIVAVIIATISVVSMVQNLMLRLFIARISLLLL